MFNMFNGEFQDNCHFPYRVINMVKYGMERDVEVELKEGRMVRIRLPHHVMYDFKAVTRWLASEAGQSSIEQRRIELLEEKP